MFDSEYITDNYKVFKRIDIVAIMKNPESIIFISDHLKTKKMCKHAVNELTFLISYVPDEYKTQQTCNKAVIENGRTLKFVLDYKNQKICNQAVDNYVDALKYVPESFKAQEMCEKAVDICPFVFDSIPDRYKNPKCVKKLFLKILLC